MKKNVKKCLVEFQIPKLCLIFPNPSFLIDEYAKIQSREKLHGCCTFGDYADAFVASVFKYFVHITTQVMSHVIAT